MESTKTIELFGKQIEIRKEDCLFYDEPPRAMEKDRLNLFIQLNNNCNARCKFCEYHGEDTIKSFNYDKLHDILSEIHSNIKLAKLNFTGGEPTLNMKHFDKVMKCCLDATHGDTGELTVNTNGVHLMDLADYMEYIDYIGLSRHHYDDTKNAEIFGTDTVASAKDIVEFQLQNKNPYKLNGRCNLIKNYIDSIDEVKKYLDWCISINMLWIGLVTLMPLNQFCKDNEVLADGLINCKDFVENQQWKRWVEHEDKTREMVCQCGDYLYTSHGKMLIFYNRIFCNNKLNAGQLVYDGKNLHLGFGGEIIY